MIDFMANFVNSVGHINKKISLTIEIYEDNLLKVGFKD